MKGEMAFAISLLIFRHIRIFGFMAHILIIEDDISFAGLLQDFLEMQGYRVSMADTIAEGINLLNTQPDALLLDYRLPDGTGMDILAALTERNMSVPAIMMTSFHDVRLVVATMRSGACDYITKPVNPEELLLALRDALTKRTPSQQVTSTLPQFIEGRSGAAHTLYEHMKLVAGTDYSVILQGNSGTGKELAAANIHKLSRRSSRPFVALDCGALSPELAGSELFGHIKGAFTGAVQNKRGQFELAKGGTLFLDEVGNLSYDIQVKLLRALQEQEITPVGSTDRIKTDVRIITATNDDLQVAVNNGKFRLDLYHRLNEFKILLPSLQQRKEDMDMFISYFIDQANQELGKNINGISDTVKGLFMRYDWPGNFRELKNIIRRAVLLTNGDKIGTEHLPEEMLYYTPASQSAIAGLKDSKEQKEKELIIKTLIQTKYNKSKAAKLLNVDRSTLYYKMTKYGIHG